MGRENILKKIKKNKPTFNQLPVVDSAKFNMQVDLSETFKSCVEQVGGRVFRIRDKSEIIIKMKELFNCDEFIISFIDGLEMKSGDDKKKSLPQDFDKLDAAIIKGQFGVAENGAVWVSDNNFSHRFIPFITAHLIIVLDLKNLVENMHEACLELNEFNEGYGVFISGPSKTADIEQSLVIGAQGPLSLTIFLMDEKITYNL